MKYILIYSVLFITLLGCNKEKQINKTLNGKWEVDRKDLWWGNNPNGQPTVIFQEKYATIEFDNNGKGQMIVPEGVYYIDGNPVWYEAETVNLEYLNDGKEVIVFAEEFNNEIFDLTWEWNKKSFVLSLRGMNSQWSGYSELELVCKKVN